MVGVAAWAGGGLSLAPVCLSDLLALTRKRCHVVRGAGCGWCGWWGAVKATPQLWASSSLTAFGAGQVYRAYKDTKGARARCFWIDNRVADIGDVSEEKER
jgi:hypothetical protein